MEQKQSLQLMVLGKLHRYVQKKPNQNKTRWGENADNCNWITIKIKKKTKKPRPPTYAIHKNKLKVTKSINVSQATIKILEENIGSKITDISCSNSFADISLRALETNQKINKWDYIKLKSSCITKETISKTNGEPTVLENIFAHDTPDKGLFSKIYKELIKPNTRKTKKSIKKWAKDLIYISPRRHTDGPQTWKNAQHH